MLLFKAIEGFIVAKLASGYSSNTLGMYRVYLKLLSSFLHDADVNTITSTDLERFMAWVSTELYSGEFSPHARYTSQGHNLRFFEGLKVERQQGI